MRIQPSVAVLVSTLSLMLTLSGCGDDPAPGDDAGANDTGLADTSANDTGANDAGLADTGANDTASGDTGSGDTGPTLANVTIDFAHLVEGAPVVLGTDRPYTNAAGNEFGVNRLSYFVSDVILTLMDGTVVSAPGAHYVDHETPETTSYALPVEVPTGELAQISFVMGLPPALNLSGAFGSAPESLMEWPEPMGGGYHYMKFEGRYLNAESEPFNFMTHSGGLNGSDYSFAVVLDASGVTLGAETTLRIEMNLEEWFTNPNTWDLNDYFNVSHRGIMGDASAQASLQGNGATVFTLGNL